MFIRTAIGTLLNLNHYALIMAVGMPSGAEPDAPHEWAVTAFKDTVEHAKAMDSNAEEINAVFLFSSPWQDAAYDVLDFLFLAQGRGISALDFVNFKQALRDHDSYEVFQKAMWDKVPSTCKCSHCAIAIACGLMAPDPTPGKAQPPARGKVGNPRRDGIILMPNKSNKTQ